MTPDYREVKCLVTNFRNLSGIHVKDINITGQETIAMNTVSTDEVCFAS